MERATGTEVYGCGSPQSTDITLNIQTTTGGNFSISVNGKSTIEHLKKMVSKKCKVSKDRICLLHRERQLRDGTLEENGVMDGARVILLPSVETGLLSQRPENSVMQALESLNETQVNDFLSGKSPLNLTMRLGDHMMLIQLQLSTLNSGSSRQLRTPTPTKNTPIRPKKDVMIGDAGTTEKSSKSDLDSDMTSQEKPTRTLQKKDLEILKNAFELYNTLTEEKLNADTSEDKDESMDNSNCSEPTDTSEDSEQSPIKSLSNLVSSPLNNTPNAKDVLVNSVKSSLIDLLANKSKLETSPSTSGSADKSGLTSNSLTPDSSVSDDSDNFADQSSFLAENTIDEYPMEHLFNSAVDKGLFQEEDESMMDREISNLATTSHGMQETTSSGGTLPSFQSLSDPLKTKRFQYLLHKTSKFKHPVGQTKQKVFMQSVVNKHKKRMQIRQDSSSQPSTSRTEPYLRKLILQPSCGSDEATPSTSKQTFKAPDTPKKQCPSPTPQVETKDLIEASKNLTQKLKKLSKEVLTNKIDLRNAEETVRSKIGPGAVIESMKHHGKGIYSGTFSGTLNPALQDRYGRPKRDISTIIHILNDLLCASPSIALTQKDSKHACISSKAEDTKNKCLGCSQPSCSYGQCDGHVPSTSSDKVSKGTSCVCGLSQECQCSRVSDACPSCNTSLAGDMCSKCDTANTLAIDNSKTKCKLEQLRLVMQQKKQRREARKMKTLPYNSPPKTLGSPDTQTPMQEEIETIA